jgi:hypothetical protein
MSELLQPRRTSQDLRRQLLATASALVLMGFVDVAQASDDTATDHPLVWIELGGQFDTENNPAQTWTPPNVPPQLSHDVFEPLGRMPGVGYDWDGKVSFQPDDSDWIYSASIQFGKAKRGPKFIHDQTHQTHATHNKYKYNTNAFTDSHSVSDLSHLVVDFQAGKDLGIGLFGHGRSTVNFGIRMAQFTENSHGTVTAEVSASNKYALGVERDADIRNARRFSGIGPSIDWKASIPLVGSLKDGIAFDWGASAAFLFGRQKTDGIFHTKEIEFTGTRGHHNAYPVVVTHMTSPFSRRKQVIVPDVGGFAGVSYTLNGRAKLSLGYRADFFFGAIDGGIETRKSENVGFYGPFASVSVGLGG